MRKKPSKEELVETLELISKSDPPKFSSSLSDVAMPFRKFNDKHPQLTTHLNFFKIYTPGKSSGQMADEIRGHKKRGKERGFGEKNTLLLNADKFLFSPREVIKPHKVKVSKEELFSFLRITFYLQKQGLSVDGFFDTHGYPDNVKRLIAEGFNTFFEVGTMFRRDLYKDYERKGKIIEKMPETGPYYMDVIRFNIGGRKSHLGKKPVRKTIDQDIKSFKSYLLSGNFRGRRNRAFYAKRFRYMAYLIDKISSIIDVDMNEEEKNKVSNLKPVEGSKGFSMDKTINDTVWKPRDSYMVASLPLQPPIISLSISSK
jgi:hypothetical protein